MPKKKKTRAQLSKELLELWPREPDGRHWPFYPLTNDSHAALTKKLADALVEHKEYALEKKRNMHREALYAKFGQPLQGYDALREQPEQVGAHVMERFGWALANSLGRVENALDEMTQLRSCMSFYDALNSALGQHGVTQEDVDEARELLFSRVRNSRPVQWALPSSDTLKPHAKLLGFEVKYVGKEKS